jgi:hypothetical protein
MINICGAVHVDHPGLALTNFKGIAQTQARNHIKVKVHKKVW